MIGVIDYDRGNLHSVTSALKRIEVPYLVSDQPEELKEAEALLLPGVGHFRDAMEGLEKKGLVPFLQEQARQKPFLGICLGMQLLFDESEEGGMTKGLGLLPGKIKRFTGVDSETDLPYKVPHMGWNRLTLHLPTHPLFSGLKADYVYFVHSYLAAPDNPSTVLASADYHERVPAIVGEGQIFGAQFHPEKSGAFGQALLKNFYRFVCENRG
ncbi:MAG TPA: imidazole glycerol phosphate synthase subunit HisH [Candidatus Angelobacter sp.]|nr:imidazole glycerol phosphate synthase subunit HisH [Candidatus Angelobacter sp.]